MIHRNPRPGHPSNPVLPWGIHREGIKRQRYRPSFAKHSGRATRCKGETATRAHVSVCRDSMVQFVTHFASYVRYVALRLCRRHEASTGLVAFGSCAVVNTRHAVP